jgi:hypothetical protein
MGQGRLLQMGGRGSYGDIGVGQDMHQQGSRQPQGSRLLERLH